MKRYKFIVSPPWDDTVDVLFEVEANDSNGAMKAMIDNYQAMYGETPLVWRHV